jgi:hypothetical protein
MSNKKAALIVIVGCFLVAAAFMPAQTPGKTAPPVIPDSLQANYWKNVAIFHSIDSDMLAAQKRASDDKQALENQGKAVDAAAAALREVCDPSVKSETPDVKDKPGFTKVIPESSPWMLDAEQLKKAVIVCVAKPLSKESGQR